MIATFETNTFSIHIRIMYRINMDTIIESWLF